jgi:hypothetical protein
MTVMHTTKNIALAVLVVAILSGVRLYFGKDVSFVVALTALFASVALIIANF